jgi:hypothetical protein
MEAQIIKSVLMYFILPVWLAAGFIDYLCHRRSNIEGTSGWRESVLHICQLTEMGIPVLALMFFEINALIIAGMIVFFLLHEATAWWDVAYAHSTREITPTEQHVHGFLERLPLMGLTMVVVLYWGQFLALFGLGAETARFDIALKRDPLPAWYLIASLSAVVLFAWLPYGEEIVRCLRAERRRSAA